MAENLRFTIFSQFFSHTTWWHKHFIQHMYITVQANNVLLHHARIINIRTGSIAIIPSVLVTNDKRHVTTSYTLLLHVIFQEVRHHRL